MGDIDAFIKIPRPDGKVDEVGFKVLDEPCAKQSDPTVLDLTLRSISKQPNLKTMVNITVTIADVLIHSRNHYKLVQNNVNKSIEASFYHTINSAESELSRN